MWAWPPQAPSPHYDLPASPLSLRIDTSIFAAMQAAVSVASDGDVGGAED
jgi:hypothetical protein